MGGGGAVGEEDKRHKWPVPTLRHYYSSCSTIVDILSRQHAALWRVSIRHNGDTAGTPNQAVHYVYNAGTL